MHALFMNIIMVLKYHNHNYDEIIIQLLNVNRDIRMQIITNIRVYECPRLIERLYKTEQLLYRKYLPIRYIVKFYTQPTINSYFCWVIDQSEISRALVLLESKTVTICVKCANRLYLKNYLGKYVKNIPLCTICPVNYELCYTK
jgi:hypothetical protein